MIAFLLLTGVGALYAQAADLHASFKTDVKPFLVKYCISCHGPDKQKGDRQFDDLDGALTTAATGQLYQDVLDQLNLAEMPPAKQKQPTPQETKRVVDWLTKSLASARQAGRKFGGKVVLRRLNRTEYFNTVRDLFQLNMADFDPTETFPADDATEGFDNVGEGLLTSDFLMNQYLVAARRVVEKGVRPGEKPKIITVTAKGKEIQGGGHLDQRGFKRTVVSGQFSNANLGKRFRYGVKADGEYLIRIRANVLRWTGHRFDLRALGYDPQQKPRIRVFLTSYEQGPTATRVLGDYDVNIGDPKEIEIKVWLQKGFGIAVQWANGPRGSQKRIMRKVFPKYHSDTIELARNPVEMFLGAAPELRLHSMSVAGPFYKQWPLPGQSRFFADAPAKPDVAYLRKTLIRFASVAFRKPTSKSELQPYLKLAEKRLAEKKDFWDAAKFGMRAMLVSPRFLYLVEPGATASTGVTQLDDYELATRLSYFLWSSTPDDALLEAAKRGELHKSEVLTRHVDRMLSDKRSKAFSRNFVGQWLGLRKLGEMPPDPAKDKSYYEDHLESAMKTETIMFFNHLMIENKSVLNFVDSDFTYANQALAKHYGLAPVTGDAFQRVVLKKTDQRGGLLGQGSVLTLTSNGVETQPVYRGVWVLENLLGTPPSPPPPDVQPVEPDTRGVTTIRELMEKHRSNPTCFECHRKIDPIGLALEKFDHIGRYRSAYSKKLRIDDRGEMPDGSKIDGVAGIKRFLLARPDQFTHCLTEKLMVYALGRRVVFTDRDDIEHVVADLRKKGYGLRDLIHLITQTKAFQTQ